MSRVERDRDRPSSRATAKVERRVLVLAPTSRDAALIASVLADAGVESEPCQRLTELCAAATDGAAALLLPEEVLVADESECLDGLLARQPSWSDLPVLLLTARGADSERVARATATLGNVTLLERPIRVAALLSTVHAALRARARQYQIRGYLAEQEQVAEALREADRRKDEFLAILAHELRNPLAPIRNSLYLLRQAGDDLHAIAAIRERMDRQVDIIVRLVDDLLEISRITRGLIELRLESVDLASVLEGAIENTRLALDDAEHELSLDVVPGSLFVEADPLRLSQVFGNLLGNAAKYTEPGGRITVSAQREGAQARVSVRDTGIGIRPELLTRVFDMFTQGDGARDRAPGGLGIGLTLVRRLTELHGGRVEARSEGLGRGSEFVVHLPLAARMEPLPTPPPADDTNATQLRPLVSNLSALHVLVVDDNRDAADSLALLLQCAVASVRVARSGAEALEVLDLYRPSVALLDIGMPHMNGYELATRIRARPELRPIVLVALTGWGQEGDRRRAREAGFDHHLVKPIAPEVLQQLLGSLHVQTHAGE